MLLFRSTVLCYNKLARNCLNNIVGAGTTVILSRLHHSVRYLIYLIYNGTCWSHHCLYMGSCFNKWSLEWGSAVFEGMDLFPLNMDYHRILLSFSVQMISIFTHFISTWMGASVAHLGLRWTVNQSPIPCYSLVHHWCGACIELRLTTRFYDWFCIVRDTQIHSAEVCLT